jgi:hypothetical protein
MARKNSRRRRNSRRRSQRGGNWTSASTYGEFVNGDGPAQFDRTFSTSSEYAGRVGSGYVGAQGQWGHQPNTPSETSLNLIQSAGRRRKRRGGFLGPIINQAIIPGTILAMQQTYRRRGNGNNKTFRRKRFSRRSY